MTDQQHPKWPSGPNGLIQVAERDGFGVLADFTRETIVLTFPQAMDGMEIQEERVVSLLTAIQYARFALVWFKQGMAIEEVAKRLEAFMGESFNVVEIEGLPDGRVQLHFAHAPRVTLPPHVARIMHRNLAAVIKALEEVEHAKPTHRPAPGPGTCNN